MVFFGNPCRQQVGTVRYRETDRGRDRCHHGEEDSSATLLQSCGPRRDGSVVKYAALALGAGPSRSYIYSKQTPAKPLPLVASWGSCGLVVGTVGGPGFFDQGNPTRSLLGEKASCLQY